MLPIKAQRSNRETQQQTHAPLLISRLEQNSTTTQSLHGKNEFSSLTHLILKQFNFKNNKKQEQEKKS